MVKPRITQTMPHDSPGALVFWRQHTLAGDDPFPLKFAFELTHPLSNTMILTTDTPCNKNLYLPIVQTTIGWYQCTNWPIPIIGASLSYRYTKQNLFVCVHVCFFVPYAPPQFWAYLHDIWNVAFLYPPDGHGWLASVAWAHELLFLKAIRTPLQISGRSWTSD